MQHTYFTHLFVQMAVINISVNKYSHQGVLIKNFTDKWIIQCMFHTICVMNSVSYFNADCCVTLFFILLLLFFSLTVLHDSCRIQGSYSISAEEEMTHAIIKRKKMQTRHTHLLHDTMSSLIPCHAITSRLSVHFRLFPTVTLQFVNILPHIYSLLAVST